jgi:hypothetical protein
MRIVEESEAARVGIGQQVRDVRSLRPPSPRTAAGGALNASADTGRRDQLA